ncbi:hypothetical protein NQ317_012110 [Molorchus minor]|uniref:Transposase n=1 Tax=Molorchus minor TaxID=1323400 RepID=A0ABQ9J164_9CUCU|nr:hypothetical protein NQ317_012110 [Molorchus minor]
MPVLEKERIEILMMVGYRDGRRTATRVCELFNNTHQDRPPIVQCGHVRDIPRTGSTKIGENTQLDFLLTVQENPHVSTRQVAATMDISKSSISRVLLKHKYHPYKAKLVHELSEDDFDRRNFGTILFYGNLNGERYLEFLRMELFPTLIDLFPNANDPNSIDDKIWFQQEGAPPHYALPVGTYLNELKNANKDGLMYAIGMQRRGGKTQR